MSVLSLQEFMELAGKCADAMPADSPPFARHLVDAYENLQRELALAKEAAAFVHYEWGRTLGRIERTKAFMDKASREFDECLEASIMDHRAAVQKAQGIKKGS